MSVTEGITGTRWFQLSTCFCSSFRQTLRAGHRCSGNGRSFAFHIFLIAFLPGQWPMAARRSVHQLCAPRRGESLLPPSSTCPLPYEFKTPPFFLSIDRTNPEHRSQIVRGIHFSRFSWRIIRHLQDDIDGGKLIDTLSGRRNGAKLRSDESGGIFTPIYSRAR